MIPAPQKHSKALGPGVTGPELLIPTSAPLERPPAPTPCVPSCGSLAFSVDPKACMAGDQGGNRCDQERSRLFSLECMAASIIDWQHLQLSPQHYVGINRRIRENAPLPPPPLSLSFTQQSVDPCSHHISGSTPSTPMSLAPQSWASSTRMES